MPRIVVSFHATNGAASICPRQNLLQICKELLPAEFGALVGLLLIRPEARLLHAQVGPRSHGGERPGDDTLETHRTPGVRQRFVRREGQELTIDLAPVPRKIETQLPARLEILPPHPPLHPTVYSHPRPALLRINT